MEVPKRITIFSNTDHQLRKVILIYNGDSLSELLSKALKKLWNNSKGSKIFFPSGAEMDDLELLRDNDVVYISKGESFQGKFYFHPLLFL